MKLILPKKRKINDVEEIALPMVKCSFCGKLTSSGMKQTRLDIVEEGKFKTINGVKKFKPARMKQIEYYMCPSCIKKGAKWPGQRP